MVVVNVVCERSRCIPGFFRAVVTLRVRALALDLFYNGASGYRAQYYHAPELGTAANRFAIDQLLPNAIREVAAINKRTCRPDWVEKSLGHSDAKLWPHQGTWLRRRRMSDQNLLVTRWLARHHDPDNKRRMKAKRSILTPAKETKLELKGGFLSLRGNLRRTFKPHRSRELHELGYT